MISMQFELGLPWYQDVFKTLWSRSSKLAKHKAYECQVIYEPSTLLLFSLRGSWRGRDHAGLAVGLGLLGLNLDFNLYDRRHWDYKNQKWAE